jgi:hypothetical protein
MPDRRAGLDRGPDRGRDDVEVIGWYMSVSRPRPALLGREVHHQLHRHWWGVRFLTSQGRRSSALTPSPCRRPATRPLSTPYGVTHGRRPGCCALSRTISPSYVAGLSPTAGPCRGRRCRTRPPPRASAACRTSSGNPVREGFGRYPMCTGRRVLLVDRGQILGWESIRYPDQRGPQSPTSVTFPFTSLILTTRLLVLRLGHVIVFVSDVAASVAFYGDVVGLEHRFTDAGYAEFASGATRFALYEQRRPGVTAGGHLSGVMRRRCCRETSGVARFQHG